jgi:hypothetical protein
MKKAVILAFIGVLLLATAVFAYETVSINLIQEVPPGQDSSDYTGQYVHTGGVVVGGTGLYYAGTGVSFYLETSTGGPWSGIMAYDSSATGYPALIPGDSITFDALVQEYNYTAGRFCTMTELRIVRNSFTFVTMGNPEPTPVIIPSAAYIDSTGGSDSLLGGEQFEGVYCRINDITVDTTIIFSSTSTWICSDSSGHQMMVREASDSINGFLPPIGTHFAYVQGVIYHRFGCYNLQPRYMRDMALPTGAPIISNVYNSPTNPIYVSASDADSARISANVVDDSLVQTVWLKYRFNLGNWQSQVMTVGTNNYYSFTFPPLPAGYTVDYYIKAIDNRGDSSKYPDQAPISFKRYKVQTPHVMTIAQARADADGDFLPDLIDTAVTLYGVATSTNFTTTTTTDFFMQDGQAGIGCFLGSATVNVNIGDSIKAIGTIAHYYGRAQVVCSKVSRISILGTNKAFDTLAISCEQLGDSIGESYEGRLVMVRHANLLDTPNSWPVLGSSATMTIVDIPGDSATLRVDRSTNIPGQIRPLLLQKIVGVVGQYDLSSPYRSGYQLQPRRYLDFVNDPAAIDDISVLPTRTTLYQNYPNPFNPTTMISFYLNRPGDATLAVFDLLGRKVFETTKTDLPVGVSSINWHGADSQGQAVSSGIYFYQLKTGDFSETKRMMLLK